MLIIILYRQKIPNNSIYVKYRNKAFDKRQIGTVA